jgi:hypothetical protein
MDVLKAGVSTGISAREVFANSDTFIHTASGVLLLAVNDVLTLSVVQNSGGDRTYKAQLAAVYVGNT